MRITLRPGDKYTPVEQRLDRLERLMYVNLAACLVVLTLHLPSLAGVLGPLLSGLAVVIARYI